MRRILIILPLVLLLAACGGSPAVPALQSAPQSPQLRNAEASPAADEPQQPTPQLASTPIPTSQPSPTPTFEFALQFTPAPTETPLPPLELPSPQPGAPDLLAWDGQPTYLGESQPDYYFRVRYNPDVWALIEDDFGQPALGHRDIPYCVIVPATGRGLPLNVVVEHDFRKLGEINYEINTAYAAGQMQFVTYLGGDGVILTLFEVNFKEDAETCISDAEGVLVTLTSVAQSRATPIP